MFAFLMMVSGAALVAAQPMEQPSGLSAGPVPATSLAVRLTAPNEPGDQGEYRDQSIKPFNVDLPAVADGAKLHVKGARLKLKVPI